MNIINQIPPYNDRNDNIQGFQLWLRDLAECHSEGISERYQKRAQEAWEAAHKIIARGKEHKSPVKLDFCEDKEYTRICPECGTEFTTNRSNQKYCKSKCTVEHCTRVYREKNKKPPKQPVKKICANPACGMEFETADARQKYHSTECRKVNTARKMRERKRKKKEMVTCQ